MRTPVSPGKQEQEREHDGSEHDEGAELAVEVRGGALLDGLRNLAHLGRAVGRAQHLLA